MGNNSFWLGKKFSDDHRAKLSASHKGIRCSPSTEFKRGNPSWLWGTKGKVKPNSGSFKKGNVPWHTGKKRLDVSGKSNWNWKGGKPRCEICSKTVWYTSKRCFKHRFTGKTNYNWKGGPEFCRICRKAIARSTKSGLCINHYKGKDHHSWRGGISKSEHKIRNSVPYKLWRTAVLRRDKRKCVNCGSDNKLVADHIKPFIKFPELRFELSNGRTLCHACDLKLGWKHWNDK